MSCYVMSCHVMCGVVWCVYEGNPSSGGYAKHVVSPSEIRTPIVRSFVNADDQPDICMYEDRLTPEFLHDQRCTGHLTLFLFRT